jgi:hypothetical protein
MATTNTTLPFLNESVRLVALTALNTSDRYNNLLANNFGSLAYTEPNLGVPTGVDTTTISLGNNIVSYWDFSGGTLTNKVDGTNTFIGYYNISNIYNSNLKTSINFENSKTQRYYLQILRPRNKKTDDLNFLNDFTLSFWIKLSSNDNLPITQDLFYKGDSIKNYVPFSAYVTYDQITKKRYITFTTSTGNGPSYSKISLNTGYYNYNELTDNIWNFVAVVGNINENSLTTYVNGVSTNQITNWNPVNALSYSYAYPFEVGFPSTKVNNGGFSGGIAQLIFWQRSLNKTETLQLYNGGDAYNYPFGTILPRYYFHVFSPSINYKKSRRYTGYNTFSIQNSKISYNNLSPIFDIDINGDFTALSAYIPTLSTNYILSDGGVLNIQSDSTYFDSPYVNINTAYTNSLTANSLYSTHIDYLSSNTNWISGSSDFRDQVTNGGITIEKLFISQSLTANNLKINNKTISSQITANDSVFNELTSQNLNLNTLNSTDLYASNLHGQIDLDPSSSLIYYDNVNLSINLSNSYTFGVKPSDSNSIDDLTVRTINGAWDNDSTEPFTPNFVLKPFFQNIKAVFDYIKYYSLNGKNLNILIYDDIQEGVQKTGVDGGYSACTYGPNLSGAYYSTTWLNANHPALGLKGGQFLWDLTANVDTFSYLTVPCLDFTSINIYGLYEIGSKVSTSKTYTFDKPFNLSPRKISFRTYLCVNPSLAPKTFSNDPRDFTDLSPDNAKHSREISFEHRTSNVIIQNLCFEFETNALDSQALFFNAGNYYLKNLTIAINGNGKYDSGIIAADEGANVYICGTTQTDPYFLENSTNWANLNQPNYIIPGATNGKHYPGYGIAIVGQQNTSNQPTWVDSFFNIDQNAKISILDYNNVRSIGLNSQLNASIILDGYFNSQYFYKFNKNDSLIYTNNNIFRTTSFTLSNLATTNVLYNNSNRINFTNSNNENFYGLYFKGSYNIFTPHNYGLLTWSFYSTSIMIPMNYDSNISINNGFVNDLFVFSSSKTINVSNMVKSLSAKNQIQKFLPGFDYDKINNYAKPSDLIYYDYGYYNLITPFDASAAYTLNYYSANASYYKTKHTPQPTPTPTVSVTVTVTPTQSITPTHTPTSTHTPTHSITPSNTITKSITPTHTATKTPPVTQTPTKTPTGTPQPTPTITRTPAQSRTPTKTPPQSPSVTKTPKASQTITPTQTPTHTVTSSITPTPKATSAATATPTQTKTPKGSPTATRTPKVTSTTSKTPKPSQTLTGTPKTTSTVTKTLTKTPKVTSTISGTPKGTPAATTSQTNRSPQKPFAPVLYFDSANGKIDVSNGDTSHVKFRWMRPQNYKTLASGIAYDLTITNTKTGQEYYYEYYDTTNAVVTDLPTPDGTDVYYEAYMTATVGELTSDMSNIVKFTLVFVTPTPTPTQTKTPTPTVGAIYNTLSAVMTGEFENPNIATLIKQWVAQGGETLTITSADGRYGKFQVVAETSLDRDYSNPDLENGVPKLPTHKYRLKVILTSDCKIYSTASNAAALTISAISNVSSYLLYLNPNTKIIGAAGNSGVGGRIDGSKGGNGGTAIKTTVALQIFNQGQIIGGGGGGGGGAGEKYSITVVTDTRNYGNCKCAHKRSCSWSDPLACVEVVWDAITGVGRLGSNGCGCDNIKAACTSSNDCTTGRYSSKTTNYTKQGGYGGLGYGLNYNINPNDKTDLDATKGKGGVITNNGNPGYGGNGGGYGGLTLTMKATDGKKATRHDDGWSGGQIGLGGIGGSSIQLSGENAAVFDGYTKSTISAANGTTIYGGINYT